MQEQIQNFAAALATLISITNSKNPPVGADSVIGIDTENSNALVRFTHTNMRTFYKALYDTLYAGIAHTHEVDERADIFNDAEGNASSVGAAADGTSAYAARRDHVHDTTSGEAVLGSVFSITNANGVMQDTGLSVTLPSAGKYKITASIRGVLVGTASGGTTVWWLVGELYNNTDGATIANSERLIVLTSQAGVQFQMTCTLVAEYSPAASKVVRLRVSRNGNGTPAWTASQIESNSAGRTVLHYEKIG